MAEAENSTLSAVQFTHPHFGSTKGRYLSPGHKPPGKQMRVLTDQARGVKANVYREGDVASKFSANVVGGKNKNGSSGHHTDQATRQAHDMPRLTPKKGSEKGAPKLTAATEKARKLGGK